MWDERYSSSRYVYGTQPNDFLAANASRIPAGRVLSLADGEGRNGVYLASLGYQVTSVDASPVGLGKAARLAASRGVPLETIVADLAVYEPAAASWKGVVSIFCHLPEPLRRVVHERAIRALAPGGVFVLEAYAERQLEFGTGGPKSLDLLLSLEELRSELSGLDELHAGEFVREIHEGALHDGQSAVVQFIGRKRG